MQLETYISDLLYRYNCVVIPNFGAFLTNKTSAKIEQSTQTFYPPKKVLSFNEQIQNSDGILANYIADIEKIPFASASEKIEKQVQSIKSYLIEGEIVKLENIGELLLNTEGKIVFTPSFHINYLTDAFGLSQFESIDIKREALKEEVETIEEVIPVAFTPEKRKNTNWFKYAAIAVVCLGLGGLGANYYYNNTVENHNQIAQEEADAQLDAKVQEATFVINKPLPAVTLLLDKENLQQYGNYHILAGAYRVEANAHKKVRQLKAKGYNNSKNIGKNKNGLNVVIYGSFTSRSEAIRELEFVRKDVNPDAWLLIKKLN